MSVDTTQILIYQIRLLGPLNIHEYIRNSNSPSDRRTIEMATRWRQQQHKHYTQNTQCNWILAAKMNKMHQKTSNVFVASQNALWMEF